MENAEEVMQLLEEFSKIKPKEIPRELEDYLGYVAKTGDPVYQWSLVKNLFREKLMCVITDFYETTLTVELPPCPNVDPFNYERMKTSLIERFDTFSSAPFTVQRICELLTNPRKEYNRADKYMRAIEKNILVVSTREPGTGKRPLECDSQSETVLNGIPDMKLNESDGSFLHVPTELPYLGAPPASNDVTVETTEPNSTINDKLNLGLDNTGDSKNLKSECDKSWLIEESPVIVSETKPTNTTSDTLNEDGTGALNIEGKGPEDDNCDTNDRLTADENMPISADVSPENIEGESSSMIAQNSETEQLPDTGIIDSSQECSEISPSSTGKLENEDEGIASDENEVSSTPAETIEDVPLIQEEAEEPTDSEAEATHKSLIQHVESDIDFDSLPDSEINSSDLVVKTEDAETVTTGSEVTATISGEVDLECNEISGTVGSPISPENNSLHDDLVDQNVNLNELDECEESDSLPDSSNDVGLCLQSETKSVESLDLQKPVSCSEPDSMSESNINLAELQRKTDLEECAPDQTNNESSLHEVENNTQVSSPGVTNITGEDSLEKSPLESELSSSSQEEAVCSNSLIQDNVKLAEIQSSSEVAEEMFDQERREGSIIHSVSNVPDSQHMSTIEEISVDPSCEAEEAMDVDDGSNQMMVSEGENEGEPMDQCDQLQS